MENSENETEINQSLKSPPRRRRSTFFERRDSYVPQPMTDNIESVIKKNSDVDKRNVELSIYYEKLLSEKNHWKREVNERRNRYHNIRQQYETAIKAPSQTRMCYSILSNEDIEFFKAQPNIYKLADSAQSLHKSLYQTTEIMRRSINLDEEAVSYCEAKVNEITEQIFENSTVNSVD